MKIGIFGGTFDPIHLGHLIVAEQAREQTGLDQLWFMVGTSPPHKTEKDFSAFDRRSEMLKLAIAGNPSFSVSEMERDREGPSYTVDTLKILKEEHRQDDFFLVIGADTLIDFGNWYQPEKILQMATLLVAGRPGRELPTEPDYQKVETPLIDIASRNLRSRVKEGKSIRYQVPRAVEIYIQEKNLYR